MFTVFVPDVHPTAPVVDKDGSLIFRISPRPAEAAIDPAGTQALLRLIERRKGASKREADARADLAALDAEFAKITAREIEECRPLRAERAEVAKKQETARVAIEDAEIEVRGLLSKIHAEARAASRAIEKVAIAQHDRLAAHRSELEGALVSIQKILDKTPRIIDYALSQGSTPELRAHVEDLLTRAGVPLPERSRAASAT